MDFSALARPRHGVVAQPSRHGRPEDPSAASPERAPRTPAPRDGPGTARRRPASPLPFETHRAGRRLQVHPLAGPVVEFTPARAVRSLRLRGRATRAADPSGAAGHSRTSSMTCMPPCHCRTPGRPRPPRATVRFWAVMNTVGLPHTGRTSVRAGTPRPAGAPPAPQGRTTGSTPGTPRTSRTSRATQATSTCTHVQMCHGLFATAPAQCTAARRNVALLSAESPDSIHASESHTYEQTSEGAGHSSRARRAPAVVWSAAPL